MKTFKLKALSIIEDTDGEVNHRNIPLIDGLTINREDEENQWIIEAFIEDSHFTYFQELKNSRNEVIIQVKITKVTNAPAIFITSIIEMNKIGKDMNILFKGTIIDHHKEEIEDMLQSLIEKDLQGEELLLQFKKKLKNT